MAKIIKNTSNNLVDIPDTGICVLASPGSYTIPPQDYPLWAASINIVSLVEAGTLIVNDGIRDLSSADGVRFLKHPDEAFNQRFSSNPDRNNGFTAKNTQEAIEEARNTVNAKLCDFEFFSSGSTFNKWLNIGHPSTASNDIPLIAPYSGKAIAIDFSNSNNNSSTDIEIYVNGSLVYTWQIRNKRTAYLALNAGIFSLNQGDRLSMYAKRATGVDPANISGQVTMSLTSLTDGSGGTQNGV